MCHTAVVYLVLIAVNIRQVDGDDDRWVWGYADDDVNDSYKSQQMLEEVTDSLPTEIIEEEANPCNRPLPEMPDFGAPGRRISEIKCYEYMWMIKLRMERAKTLKECTNQANPVSQLHPDIEFFVIGGRSADSGEFPHMGAIGWKAVIGTWIFKCGSSLISTKFVLTAAHCTKASPRDTTIADIEPKIVRLGDKNIIDNWSNGLSPEEAFITRIIVHPYYNSPAKYFDIALLELDREFEFFKNVQPACLWTTSDTSSLGAEATATGWGIVETYGLENSPDLQVVDLDIIDSQTCDGLLAHRCSRLWCGLAEHQICAGKLDGGADTCKGDSGGPLQVKIPLPTTSEGAMHYVIGVTSFGFGCALADMPGVYTRVSSFVDWIEDIVWR